MHASAAPRFRLLLLGAALLGLAGTGALLAMRTDPPRVSKSSLRHDVYVWQRQHTAGVAEAVRAHAADFGITVVLAVEITWKKAPPLPPLPGGKREHASPRPPIPVVTRVAIDWAALKHAPRVGLALRINAYPGPFTRDDLTTRLFAALAHDLLREARHNGIAPGEFHIDFDATTEKLDGYREWLAVLRPAVAPVPLVFTALPAWLSSPKFPKLARAADSYVLQVHAQQRPGWPDGPTMVCNPVAARTAIEQAGRIGRPFRVALPTYAYAFAFDPSGNFAGLSAEGPAEAWLKAPGLTVRHVSAEPVTLAGLVTGLTTDRPAALTGVIWHRLPIAGDRMNWSWPTLAAVMSGQATASRLTAAPHRGDGGRIEFRLTNAGNGDFSGSVALTAHWPAGRRIATEIGDGFVLSSTNARSLRLTAPTLRLAAGESCVVGWVRLSTAVSPVVAVEG